MKIEFELEIQEAVVLLNILKSAASKEANPKVENTLRNIIREIEADSSVTHFILSMIKDKFYQNNLTREEILPGSDMYYGLGISEKFLTEPRGLTKMAYDILILVVKQYKPDADLTKIKKISNSAIKECAIVDDLMYLIEKSYEAV